MLLKSRMLRNIVIYWMLETWTIPFHDDRLFAQSDKFMYYCTHTISLEVMLSLHAILPSASEKHQGSFYGTCTNAVK